MFSNIVKIFGEEESVFIKDWDGLSSSNSFYETIVLLILNNNYKSAEDLISKCNIFEIFKLKENLENLLRRMEENAGHKQKIPILNKGGGKNIFIVINQEIFNNLLFVRNVLHSCVEKFSFQEKTFLTF